MRQFNSWFFDGYRRVEKHLPDGHVRTVLEYQGEWYGLPYEHPTGGQIKGICAGLCAGSIAFYLLASLNPAQGGMWRFVAAPAILALVPMLFLVIGFLNLMIAKEKWEKRILIAGYRRMGWSSKGVGILMGISVTMEIVFLIRNLNCVVGELGYLALSVLSFVCAVLLAVVIHRYPAQVVEGPKAP